MVGGGMSRLESVLGGVSAAAAAEVRQMWLSEGVLTPDEADRRIPQILFLIRDEATLELGGVCTVSPGLLPPDNARYWFLRMFIRSARRGEIRVSRLVLESAVTVLATQREPGSNCRGIALVVQNPKLRAGRVLARVLQSLPGWTLRGHDGAGSAIICREFSSWSSGGETPR
jgi:hypothetical protein